MKKLNSAIGSKIRSLREMKNIPMEEMAQKSGLSTQYLSVIEENVQVPTIGELIKIVRVLGVRVGTVLDDFSNDGPVISRARAMQDKPVLRGKENTGAQMSYYSLSSQKQDRHMETYIVNLHMSEEKQLSSHEGEEFMYVLEGEVEVRYGKDVYVLSKGDTIYYDSIVPHLVLPRTVGGAKLLAVVYIPV
ncbi:MAG: cupin domain-containing protein [Bacteroidales bacterium]|nr:cupin domain-containing protein [Bacteroidales bacterium]